MCGIVGIVGKAPVANRLVEALKRLEYRGYDSSGIATLDQDVLERCRAEGKLVNLEGLLAHKPLSGNTGIGHTRWATHGAPTRNNAHPHATDKVAVVHNGIIENYRELRDELAAEGIKACTETDTEIVALLVDQQIEQGADPVSAVASTLKRLEGAFALAFLIAGDDNMLIAARQGSPLAIGHGEAEMFLGSDAFALAPFTNKITYLLEGDWAVLTPHSVTIYNRAGEIVERETKVSAASSALVDKGNHRHFMAKEMFEQPETIARTLGHYLDMNTGLVAGFDDLKFNFSDLSRLTISACGTAYNVACVAKYWFEKYARLPVEVDVASEFRYREPPLEPGGLSMFISQSGETADTLAALRYCAGQGQHIAGVVNATESTIARESHAVFPILCGPEIAVASTKATTAQLVVMACLAIAAGRARKHLSEEDERELVGALVHLPGAVSQALAAEPQIVHIAKRLARVSDVLYLGRGSLFPIAMEGALKLKELSYIHAEGYAAGELKHGPIALIDEKMPVIVVAPSDELAPKTRSNLQEAAARGGEIILITDHQGAGRAGKEVREMIVMPDVHPFVAPILATIPVQLLAYHTATIMGTDVDQPRNLAKSVTVE